MVFMNGDGQVDIFTARSVLACEETITSEAPPALAAPVPNSVMPKAWMEMEILNKEGKEEVNEGSIYSTEFLSI